MFKSFFQETKWFLLSGILLVSILVGNIFWFVSNQDIGSGASPFPPYTHSLNDEQLPGLEFKQLSKSLYSMTGYVQVDDCEKIVAKLPNDGSPFSVILESPGGSLIDGACLAAHLKHRNVVTVVRDTPVINEDGEILYDPGKVSIPGWPSKDGKVMCASSCSLIFLGGDKRYLIGDVYFGIHSPRTPDEVLPQVGKRALEAQTYRTSAAIMMLLDQLGITDDDIKYLFLQVPSTSMYFLNPRDFQYKPALATLATHYKNFWGVTGEGVLLSGTHD